ncbi:hypothetical protein V5O48_001440, partial [Marasmius crinis-equi]
MDGCEVLYNLSPDCVVSKSKFLRCAAVPMQPGHTPVKRSPSTTPPPHPQHLSSGVAYPENSPRAMHSTLAIQHQHIVPYQHY